MVDEDDHILMTEEVGLGDELNELAELDHLSGNFGDETASEMQHEDAVSEMIHNEIDSEEDPHERAGV